MKGWLLMMVEEEDEDENANDYTTIICDWYELKTICARHLAKVAHMWKEKKKKDDDEDDMLLMTVMIMLIVPRYGW